uniref:DUF4158 domain-containing protein n=1 Tax=Paraburkholderia nemoris TaxID=2793076 RepID=UPI001F23D909|nr:MULTISPECIES: DUF4158 domain-containing protein [Paraburkholderia]
MPGLEFRYVGQDRLPTRLSEFDVERYFALTDSDVASINERFRRDRRAGAAIQLVFLRASGHTLDHVGTIPRQLLRYVGERLSLPTPTIASPRTLYRRYKTLYDHQVWACEYLGLTSIGSDALKGLEAWMQQDAGESLTLDELIQHARCWLYERKILMPADRTLRDLGRSIWTGIERDLLVRIGATVTEAQLVRADAVLRTQRGASGMTVPGPLGGGVPAAVDCDQGARARFRSPGRRKACRYRQAARGSVGKTSGQSCSERSRNADRRSPSYPQSAAALARTGVRGPGGRAELAAARAHWPVARQRCDRAAA